MKKLRRKVYEILRWSEKYTKTDMVYFFHGSFWLNGAQFATALVGLLLAIAFANLVSQETYGTYKYILSLYGLFGVLSLSGLGGALARAVARGNEGELKKAIIFNLKFELLITLAGVIGAVYYFVHGNFVLALGLLIIGIFSPIKDSSELYNAYLAGKKDFRATSILGVLKSAISALWLFLTIIITKNPLLIVLSYFFINTALSSLFLWWIVKTRNPNQKEDEETTNLAKHTSLMGNVSNFVDQIDNILIFHFLGPISLAVYNFAQAIPEYLGGFLKNIGPLAMPKFAEINKDEAERAIRHKSAQVFLFGAAMAGIYMIFAPIFFHIFFPKYLSSVLYSQVYSLMLLFSAVLPMSYLDSRVAIREKYYVNIISASFKTVALVLGVIYFGIWGALLARLLSKAFGVVVGYYFAFNIKSE